MSFLQTLQQYVTEATPYISCRVLAIRGVVEPYRNALIYNNRRKRHEPFINIVDTGGDFHLGIVDIQADTRPLPLPVLRFVNQHRVRCNSAGEAKARTETTTKRRKKDAAAAAAASAALTATAAYVATFEPPESKKSAAFARK